MQEHVRDAGGRRLFEGGQHAPDAVDLLLHALLLAADELAAGGVILDRGCGLLGRVQADVPELVDHVALGVPVLVLAIPEDLDKLLKDGGLASAATLGELGGVVIVAVDAAVVFVVAVLGAEDG